MTKITPRISQSITSITEIKPTEHRNHLDDFVLASPVLAKRQPSTLDLLYYNVASRINNLRATDWLPSWAYLEPQSAIPFPRTITSNGCSLHLGIQPENWLAKYILKEAENEKTVPYVISVLEPFEAKHTSKKLQAYVHLINAQDNVGMSTASIEKGVQEIERATSLGNQRIYVHCKSGKGRSATIVAAYLVKHGTMTPEHAAQYIKQHRAATVLTNRGHYHFLSLCAWAERYTKCSSPG